MSKPEPVDKELYDKIKKKIKAKFIKTSRWPSAYGSGYLVQEYKKKFKELYGNKQPYKNKKSNKKSNTNLNRWFNEKWVNVCKKKSNKYVPCGRKKGSMKQYPYCRPLKRINSKTPMTVGEIKKKYGIQKLKDMCKKKNSKKDKKSMTFINKSKSKKSKSNKKSKSKSKSNKKSKSKSKSNKKSKSKSKSNKKSKSKSKSNKKWSNSYKKSINCKKPKGFSQKQYCKYGKKS